MSIHTIYIEVSDEITTVIERLKNAPERTVALVVPRGAILLQSVVNLKLAKKAASDVRKEMVLVSTDKIGRNLAVQLGIPVVSKEQDAEAALNGKLPIDDSPDEDEPNVIAGVRIHRYYDENASEETTSEKAPAVEPIIIPKTIMKETPAEIEPAIAEPIVVPPPTPEPTPEPQPVAVPTPSEPLKRTTIDVPPPIETPTLINPEKAPATPPPPTSTPAAVVTPLPKKRRLLLFSLFVVVLLVLGVGATSFLFLPATHAVITIPAESWTKQLDFTASTTVTSISEDNKTLPAEIITGESTNKLDFKATGTKDIGETAKGTATFYNYDSTSSVTVPAGTVVTASGKTFTTQSDASVPGFTKSGSNPPVPGKGSAPVVANASGDSSNLASSPANDVRVNGVTLTFNSVSTSGGSTNQVAVVTATDIANAKTTLTNQLRDAAKASIVDQLKNRDPRFNEDADKFTLENFATTVSSGDQADGGTVSAKGTLKRLIVDYALIKVATDSRILADNKDNKSIQTDKIDTTVLTISPDGLTATFSTNSSGKQSAVVPKEALRLNLAGKSDQAGRTLVTATVPNSTLTITHRPSWWPLKRFPYSPRLLTLDITYD